MRLLIDDTFATGSYTVPIRSGWVSPPKNVTFELVPRLTGAAVAAADIALVAASELLRLQSSHDVVTAFAVVADGVGAVAMRTPVRPDEIERTPVRLLETGGGAELLARATLQSFYGITATSWIRDGDAPDAALAQVVIVEGAEALREAEGGFSEDLSRAWFILTAQPVVSHVLVVPREMPATGAEALTYLEAVRAAGLAKRREWRPAFADQQEVGRDRASTFWTAQRLFLDGSDRQALLDLLDKGSRGTSRGSPLRLRFREAAGET